MPVLNWPNIAKPMSETFTTDRVPNFVDDAAKLGTPRRRQITTRKLFVWSFTQICNPADDLLFSEFIDVTTNGGVEQFNWTHPISSVIYGASFDVLPRDIDGVPGYKLYEVSLRQV